MNREKKTRAILATNALRELLSEERIERIGKGSNREPYRYFLA